MLLTGITTVHRSGTTHAEAIAHRQHLLDIGIAEFPSGARAEPGKLRYTDAVVYEDGIGIQLDVYRNGYRCDTRLFTLAEKADALEAFDRAICAVEYTPASDHAVVCA